MSPSIADEMPHNPISQKVRESCSHLQLADPSFDTPGPIYLLLGADVSSQIWHPQQRALGPGLPSAYRSIFGWVLIGPVQPVANLHSDVSSISLMSSLESQIERFWWSEEPKNAPSTFTDEGKCEDLFASETRIDRTGRYSVSLT